MDARSATTRRAGTDCDECCDSCTRTLAPGKGIHYCAGPKAEADPFRDDLVEFLA
tara:strand:+ start:1472 stop:1636 length:165 start_codon:yes stop_codon:yes gene_type:complete